MTLTVRVVSSSGLTEALYNLILSYYAGCGCSPRRRPQQLSSNALVAALKVHFHMSTAGSLHAEPSYTFLNGPSPSIKAVNASRLVFRCGSEISPSVLSRLCAPKTRLHCRICWSSCRPFLLTCASHLADDATIHVPPLGKKT